MVELKDECRELYKLANQLHNILTDRHMIIIVRDRFQWQIVNNWLYVEDTFHTCYVQILSINNICTSSIIHCHDGHSCTMILVLTRNKHD